MSAHSPGPWILAKSGVSVDAGRTRIRQEASLDRDELKANAVLIAAAPELLDVCVALLRLAADKPTLWNLAIINKAEAAVAKAEGRP